MSKYSADFASIVSSLKASLEKVFTELRNSDRDADEWLRTLYKAYCERMRMDNERIWFAGSILLPFAATGFAALIAINNLQLWHLLALGLVSTALAWSWLIVAENHRSFQRKSEAWLVAIEKLLGVEEIPNKLFDGFLNQTLSFKKAVQWVRWIIVSSITVGWVVLIALFLAGQLVGSSDVAVELKPGTSQPLTSVNESLDQKPEGVNQLMSLESILTLIAIFSSPIVALAVERWQQNRALKTKRKETLFYDLVKSRSVFGTNDAKTLALFQDSMNLLPFVFNKDVKVMNAFSEYKAATKAGIPEEQIRDKITEIILTMAKQLRFQNIDETTIQEFTQLKINKKP